MYIEIKVTKFAVYNNHINKFGMNNNDLKDAIENYFNEIDSNYNEYMAGLGTYFVSEIITKTDESIKLRSLQNRVRALKAVLERLDGSLTAKIKHIEQNNS